ncbi:MAG: two-component system response regulator [gamma proteobacterium symbiont of Bathyaustriella thionipta]|nr:two-component system response regulator [gamma proteobacterium symbiont of Bathyaustriella thionipta]MCU7949321.1 two-component system response regulator [gamma proteobacterium symbiont of Bathyaustriella thionipta]MCU7954907.1 two-component system response regulator [gamma proteobacterium symbiont of Bathyaustriella thionipta]MCU7955910.1 two-component system response regulator [gamma proteobacterium symbiont of Bathyaustriella thionipta]MCU7968200.1 two-component system response regulator 
MSETTILIVDDEPTVLASMSQILSPFYRVRAANSGQRALDISLTEPRPQLILLDVTMPGLDGYTVLSRLKQNPLTQDIPVIFVTAMEAMSNEEKGLNLGAVDYISKPAISAILLARVKNHLVLKQASDFLHDKNVYLEAEVSRRMAENQTIQAISIRALAHLAETRDPETGDHILRTQSYVQALARQLQKHPRFNEMLSDQFIELMTRSAPLHDIGKVGIPDHVLLKPGKLNDEEWQIMKTHAQLGAQAIERAEKDVQQDVEFLALAKEIAHWHHERWDGSGYPDSLVGDEIPLSARLMAVADVFDALISQRIYKSAMSFEEARTIISNESGQQFDPDITDAFLTCFDAFVKIARKYQGGTVSAGTGDSDQTSSKTTIT